jgi:hypothetical protein
MHGYARLLGEVAGRDVLLIREDQRSVAGEVLLAEPQAGGADPPANIVRLATCWANSFSPRLWMNGICTMRLTSCTSTCTLRTPRATLQIRSNITDRAQGSRRTRFPGCVLVLCKGNPGVSRGHPGIIAPDDSPNTTLNR